MGNKARPPREPKPRSGKEKVIWSGTKRVIAIDLDSTTGFPCQIQLSKGPGPTLDSGLNMLERELVLEIAGLKGTLPRWATKEAHEKREASKMAWKEYEQERQRKQAEERAQELRAASGKKGERAKDAAFLRNIASREEDRGWGSSEQVEDVERIKRIADRLEDGE